MVRSNHDGAVAAETLNVLVVDDHLLLAETIAAVLKIEQGFHVETAPDIDDAVAAVRTAGRFDAVLLDYDVPGMDSLAGLRRLTQVNDGRVVLFSGMSNRVIVNRAIAEGAAGFIPKTLPLKTLGHAIRFIAAGEVYLPVSFMQATSGDGGFGLKPRELQVLSFLCEGLQNKEIGRELGVEEMIVKMDVKAICRKLGARNRTQAVIAAQRQGLC
jgi:DNA-binding NarL/FixJ family response regulator